MPIVPQVRPAVRAAVGALDAFGAHSAREATILLGYWSRRNELTPADIDDVLSYYPENSGGAVPAPRAVPEDPTGLILGPTPEELDRLVPPYLDGQALGSRRRPDGSQR